MAGCCGGAVSGGRTLKSSRCWQALSALWALGGRLCRAVGLVGCYLSRSPRDGRGGQPILGRVQSRLVTVGSVPQVGEQASSPMRKLGSLAGRCRQMEHGILTTPSNAARTHTRALVLVLALALAARYRSVSPGLAQRPASAYCRPRSFGVRAFVTVGLSAESPLGGGNCQLSVDRIFDDAGKSCAGRAERRGGNWVATEVLRGRGEEEGRRSTTPYPPDGRLW